MVLCIEESIVAQLDRTLNTINKDMIMKKGLFSWVLVALLGAASQAQINTFPYILDFEDGLDGWTVVDADGDNNNWYVYSYSGSHSGTHVATSWSYNTSADLMLTPNNWLISPAIELGSDTAYFSWWCRIQSIWAGEHYAVYVSTTGDSVGAFTATAPLYEATMSYDNNNVWKKDSVSLADYVGQTIHIALRHFNCSNQYNLMVDDFTIETVGGCEPITGLAVSDITSTGATVSWNNSETATSAEIVLNGVSIGTFSDPGYTFYDLQPATNYTVLVIPQCDNGSTGAVASITFSTLCEEVTELPHVEDFEGSGVGCWHYSPAEWECLNVELWATSGTHCMHSENGGVLVSPAFALPDDGETYVVSFMARPFSTTFYSYPSHFKVYVSSSAATVFDLADFVEILDTTISTSAHSMIIASLGDYSGQTVTIAIANVGNNDLFMDDFSVRTLALPVVDIEGPAMADVNIATTYAAVLSEGSTTNMSYLWTSTMESAANAAMSINDSLMTITYSALGTDTIKVVAHNDYGEDSALFIVTVRNLNQVTELPYITSFEEGQDTSWTFANGVNGWRLGTNAHSDGERGLYVSCTAYMGDSISTDSNYYNIFQTVSSSYAYRALLLVPGEYAVSFDWRCQGEEGYDFLRAILVPSGVELTANTTNGITASNLPEGFIAIGGELSGSNIWQTTEASLYIAEAGVYQLVFYWRNDGNFGDQPPAAVDNISLGLVTCFRPIDLTLDTATSDSLAFHWTATGMESLWEVGINDSVYGLVDECSFALGGLEANTPYTVKVRAKCDENDLSTALVGTLYTECREITVPYRETFSPALGFRCWTTLDVDGNGETWDIVSSFSGNTLEAPYNMYGATDDWAIMPPVTVPDDADGYKLLWDVRGGNYDADAYYEVLVSPTAGATVASFTDTLFTETYGVEAFANRSVGLDQYAGQTIRIAFRHVNDEDDDGIALDNIEIRQTNIPVIQLAGPTEVYVDEETTYDAILIEGSTNGLTFTWHSVLEAVSSTSALLYITYSAPGIDTITVIAHNSYGADTASLVVTVVDDSDTVVEPTCPAAVIDQAIATDNDITMTFTSTAPRFAVAIMSGGWAEPTTADTITGHSHVFAGLLPNTQYTVGVRALCDNGAVGQWARRSVTTASGTDGIDDASVAGVGLYPNPASDKVTIILPEPCDAPTIEVYTVDGRRVLGTVGTTFAVDHLPQGVYLLRASTPGSVYTARFSVSR